MQAASTLDWEQRFRAIRHTLPAWAKNAPNRCVFLTDLTGVIQVHVWDRATGCLRQVTDRPNGSQHCAIEASGEGVLWFSDTGGDEFGQWMRQPFFGGADTPVAPELAPSWPAGLVIGLRGHTLLGRSTESGTQIHLVRPGVVASCLYQHEEPARAVDLSRALDLVVIAHSEQGDLWHSGVRILRPDGSPVADIGSEGEGLEAVGFSPVVGDPRLLLQHQRKGRWEPLIYDPRTGEQQEIDLDLLGDVGVDWFQDGTALLVQHGYRARSSLYRYELATRTLVSLDAPPGTIAHSRTRPDGDVWFIWSSSEHPPRFSGLHGDVGFPVLSAAAPSSVPLEDAWVEGPAGPIHALVSKPNGDGGPHPTVFLLHGGPDDHDEDAFDPEAAAWVDHGFAVVRVNYRGSTGYGEAWTEALRQRVGLTELEDIAAVRRWAIEHRVADPSRLVLAGSSWGGYLTLLGLGTQPHDWNLGLAGAPVADCVAAHHAAMEDIKALDRTLFGGTPEEVPDLYRASSPSTYVADVRAPVFLCAGIADARCGIEQVEQYANRLGELGVPYQLFKLASGHSTTAIDARVEMFRRQLEFVRTHLPHISK